MAAQISFINASFAFSLAALAVFAAGYVFNRPRLAAAAPWTLGLAWAALTGGLAALWAALGRPPLSNQYESLLTLLWFVFPLAFYFRRRTERAEIVPAAALAACLLFGAAALLDRTPRPLMPALRSNWLIIHVLSSMAAYAAFALAAAAAAWSLFKAQAESEDFLVRLAKTGFAFLTLGIITGSVWAETAWGSWWSWDPKETWSLLTWLAYAAALHLRLKGLRGKNFSIALVACFGLVLFTYFGVNFLLSGMHSYAK
ncbi:MAG: cytochrome c biogenesis protein CcsA [Elusimicrobia bacterium]|nr:cytochrome c biogenesis protein CcsA [Elusimicrobiota bacterium]